MDRLLKVLRIWKNRTCLSIFNIYYLTKNDEIHSIRASWQNCYNEDDVLGAMQCVENDETFLRWLLPSDELLVEHLKENMI